MRKQLVFVAALVAIATALMSCTQSDDGPNNGLAASDEAAAPSGEPASVSPSPEPPPKLAVTKARLEGAYKVQLFVRSNSFASKPDSVQGPWIVHPKCREGACDSTFKGRISFAGVGNEDTDRVQGGAKDNWVTVLRYFRGTYSAYFSGFYGECSGAPKKDTWSFQLKPTAQALVENHWVVTKWEGTWSRDTDYGGGCDGSKLNAVIRGSRIPK